MCCECCNCCDCCPYCECGRGCGNCRSILQDPYEDNEIFLESFSTKKLRNSFVKKVYTILGCQMLLTVIIVCICMFVPVIQEFLQFDFIVLLCSGFLFFITYMVLCCSMTVRRTVPANFIVLTFLTLFLGIATGAMAAKYNTYIVLAAFGVCGVIVFSITMIAMCPCIDITGWGIYLLIASLVVMMFGMIAMIVGMILGLNVLFTIYSGLIVLLFSMYLLYDTQLILGGRKYQISSEEYIVGAVSLYVDVVVVLCALFGLMGGSC